MNEQIVINSCSAKQNSVINTKNCYLVSCPFNWDVLLFLKNTSNKMITREGLKLTKKLTRPRQIDIKFLIYNTVNSGS